MPYPQAARNPDRRTRCAGFTLIELLVVISIIALLIAILLPALGAARDSARTSQSLSNIRQIAIAAFTYQTDSKSFYLPYRGANDGAPYLGTPPTEFRWAGKLVKDQYMPGIEAFVCPSLETTRNLHLQADPDNEADNLWFRVHYGMNNTYLGSMLPGPASSFYSGATFQEERNSTPRASQIKNPTETIYFTSSYNQALLYGAALGVPTGLQLNERVGIDYVFPGADPPGVAYGHADARHQGSINVGWADGHGDNVKVSDPTDFWGPDELTDYRDADNFWDRD
jgi:prepilin-type N-terminal cleavage/methylation domain-containing protein/prepilin-type processing-associated H-X9-DG protein